jgi:putative membrane protein
MSASPFAEYPAAPPLDLEVIDWRRLNPRMIIVRPMHDGVRLLPVLAISAVSGAKNPVHYLWSIVPLFLLLVIGVVSWWRTKYRITAERIELQRGLLSRNTVSVRLDRVRTVETMAKFGHRMFGLTEVHIGTGSGDKTRKDGLKLDSVTTAEGTRLHDELLAYNATRARAAMPTAALEDREVPAAPEKTLAKFDKSWLKYAPMSASGLLTILAIASIFWRIVNETNIDVAKLSAENQASNWASHAGLIVVVAVVTLAVVLLTMLFSFIRYVLAYGNFQLTQQADGNLRIRHGLLTTRAVSIELARLRGMTRTEPFPLRQVGGAHTKAVTTGLNKRDARGGTLLPATPRAATGDMARTLLGFDPFAAELTTHPRAALWRRLNRALLLAVAFLAVTGYGCLTLHWPALWLVLAIVFVPVSIWLGIDRYRGLGHAVYRGFLVTRVGSLQRTTTALDANGIIGWRVKQTFFQRRKELAAVSATTAAGRGHYRVVDVTLSDGLELIEELQSGLLADFTE